LNRQRAFIGRLLLAMLLFGAYVPAGYMPASGTPFLVELCPAASPMPMSLSPRQTMNMAVPGHHHHGSGTHADFANCPFGSAPGAGPLSHSLAVSSATPLNFLSSAALDPWRVAARPLRAHQPRGPPYFS
jgi:hypothetical protein